MRKAFSDKYLCPQLGSIKIRAGYLRINTFKPKESLGGAWRLGRRSIRAENENGGQFDEEIKRKMRI
jgi:hypothetical protein